MSKKKQETINIEEIKEIKPVKIEQSKTEKGKENNIIKCEVVSSNFGRYKTGEIVELAKEIALKYETLGYLKRK